MTGREQRLLSMIERVTGKKIERMHMPTVETINQERIVRFKQSITDTLDSTDTELFHSIIEEYQLESGRSAMDIATALAKIAQGGEPFLMKPQQEQKRDRSRNDRERDKPRQEGRRDKPSREGRRDKPRDADRQRSPRESRPDRDMERFRLEVGSEHEVKTNNIVGAIANEAGVDSQYIKNVTIHDNYSTVDLPMGMPNDLFKAMKKVWVSGQQLNISRMSDNSDTSDKPKKKKEKKPASAKKRSPNTDKKSSPKRKPKPAS